MILTTEQHKRLAAFYAREAQNPQLAPELRERLKRKAELLGVCAILAAERNPKVRRAVAYKMILGKYPWDDDPNSEVSEEGRDAALGHAAGISFNITGGV